MPLIWVIDDDRSVRFVLAEALRDAGHAVREFEGARAALDALASEAPDLVYTDVRMPELDGFGLLESLAAARPSLPVVVMSAYTDVASTAGAFRGGAFEYLAKPFDLDEAVAVARRALAVDDTHGGDGPAREPHVDAGDLLGRSSAMREVFRALGRVAPSELNVLVTGETGTGKELVARALHRHSPRAAGPFVALNTAAIPSELLESELFGHEAGAFTGAARRHCGRFEEAAGGTLFLDEIGDMPLSLQTRLLRVLAEGEFYRVGGRELVRANARVVAATHQDLDAKVAAGTFRADLMHRLDVVRIALPPLRARRDDVPLLAERFLAGAARELALGPKRYTRAALDKLAAHEWPGNVRELENVCRRLALMAPGREIDAADIVLAARVEPGDAPEWIRALSAWARARLEAGGNGLYDEAKQQLEQALLDAALEATGGHRQRAAERLGLGRNTVTRKLGAARRRRPRGGAPA
ncbi:MAG TPA: nitrogen regulation protein NR(I) [Candidatus Saccharimonadia bacterium]|nr:nitrogen regulation protein NR(I) [Candidatus Saccharimonadia bacterium]